MSPLVIDRPITKSSCPRLDLVNHRLDLVNTAYIVSTYTLACRRRQVLAIHTICPSTLGPSVQASTSVLHCSQSIGTNPQDLHLHRRSPPPSSTPAHHKPKDMLHNPTHASVSFQTQAKTLRSLTITHHTRTSWAHIDHVFSYSVKGTG